MDLLHRIGWSVQVPARRAGERDEAAPPILEASPFKLARGWWAEEHRTEVREAR
jgi:Winged helix-turn helix